MSSVQLVGMEVMGVVKPKMTKSWVSDETLKLMDEKKRAREEVILTQGGEEEKAVYKEIRHRVKKACRQDKNRWWSQKATDLEAAASCGKMKDTFGLLKSMCKTPMQLVNVVKATNGALLDDEQSVLARWTEHFKSVLQVVEAKGEQDG